MSNFSRDTETFLATLAVLDDCPLPLGFGRLESRMNIGNYNGYNMFLMEICITLYLFL